MSKTIVKPRQNGTVKSTEDISPIKNGKGHSCSPLKRLKPTDEHEGQQQQSAVHVPPVHVDSDDAELARKLHEQLNGPESPTAAPIARHIGRVRKAPVFYKPEQFGGYQGYHGVEGGPEQEDGTGEVSPRHAKELQIPRELRRLHEHSVSMSDSEAKSSFPAGPRRTRASSVPDPETENGQAQRPLAARSADQGAKKRAEGDADTHSRSGTHQRRKQRSLTPELRLTRSMQPPQGSQPHPLPTDQRKNGRSLPVKLEQPAASGEKPALNQGSSGSPGKGTGSSMQQGGQKRRNSKPVVVDGDGTVKAEVTSNRLRQGTGGASTSEESHSHVDLAAACPDQADAVGGSGRRGSNSGAAGVSKRAKLPAKNPMVLQKQNGSYYRVRVLKEESYRVKIEFMGFEQQLQPSWLARDSERIWRGSYKNKAWKHLGDGAWEPRSGERGAPLVAHGTRQNQYTKRRALLNGAGNNSSSNNDSDDNVGSSEDRRHRDGQHGHCADTGFTAEAAALGNAQSKNDLLAQNPSSSQIKAKGAQPVGESGVLGRLEKSESSGLRAKSRPGQRAVAHASSGDSNKGRRSNPKNSEPEPGDVDSDPQEADTSSGDDAVPMDIARDGRSDEKAEGTAVQDARAAQDHDAKSSKSMDDQPSPNPSQDVGAQEATARTDRHSQKDKHPHRVKPSAVVGTAAVRDSAVLEDSGVKDEAHTSSADENRDVGSNIPKPAVNQAARASKAPKSSSGALRGAAASDTALKAAASSGSGQDSKVKEQVGPSEQQQKAGKAPSALEAALQCEEDLADDAAASPGDAAAKANEKAGDDKSKAAAESEAAPKPVVKPRRDRKGRIRGTYGINAKPVAVETPADSPPAPGVTRASLRPKPTAKASPDDEEVEMVKPAAGVRHLRAAPSGPDAGAAHDSPGSPTHIKASAPEVRKPNGRTAIQRRAAAANFAVAAAVAAEAADIMPKSIHHSSRVSAKTHSTHRRSGSNSMNRFALDHVRSGRIAKALSGGSSGAGSSGGTMRFGSLMDALGELEGREGGFRPQAHSSGALSLRASSGFGGYGGTLRPALFGSGSNGFVSRWHEPLGPVSPRILTLRPELFQLGSSSHPSAGWSVPSSCHSIVDAGMSLQPQFPLFKAS